MSTGPAETGTAGDRPGQHTVPCPIGASPNRTRRPKHRNHRSLTGRRNVHGAGIIRDHDSRL